MSNYSLDKQDSVFILNMSNGAEANALSDESMQNILALLDEVENSQDNAALVIASSDEKFWCPGLNLKWLKDKEMSFLMELTKRVDSFLQRLAMANIPTVGCLNGHAYGGGALMASTLDFRLMQKSGAKFCFPEVDVKIPFTEKMTQLISQTYDQQALRGLIFTGRAVEGDEAVALKVADKAIEADKLLEQAVEFASILAQKDRKTYTQIKRRLRANMFQ